MYAFILLPLSTFFQQDIFFTLESDIWEWSRHWSSTISPTAHIPVETRQGENEPTVPLSNQKQLRHPNSPTPWRRICYPKRNSSHSPDPAERTGRILDAFFVVDYLFGYPGCLSAGPAALQLWPHDWQTRPKSVECAAVAKSRKPGRFRKVCDRERSLRRQANVKTT